MNDKIRKAMMRPDCIMGVTPDNGGSWLSPIREDGAQPTTLPATAGQPWAIGSGMLKPVSATIDDNGFLLPASAYCGSTFDLRGYAGDLTVVCDFEMTNFPAEQSGRWWIKVFEQGNCFLGNASAFTLAMYFRKDSASGKWTTYFMHDNGTTANSEGGNADPTGRHTVAYVKDVSTGTLSGYIDGIHHFSRVRDNYKTPFSATVNATVAPRGFMLAGAPQANYFPEGMERRIHSLAVFNRALSAQEIADLS